MSRDQRPGRVRVFSSDGAAPTPMRRRTDRMPELADEELDVPAPSAAAVVTPTPADSLSWRLLAVLFLGGCALGGAAIAALGLFRVPG